MMVVMVVMVVEERIALPIAMDLSPSLPSFPPNLRVISRTLKSWSTLKEDEPRHLGRIGLFVNSNDLTRGCQKKWPTV